MHKHSLRLFYLAPLSTHYIIIVIKANTDLPWRDVHPGIGQLLHAIRDRHHVLQRLDERLAGHDAGRGNGAELKTPAREPNT